MNEIHDTYFLDAQKALKTALKRNTVPLPDDGKGLQICYYDGDPLKDVPENMIYVPFKNLYEYFSETKNRQPTYLSVAGSGITAADHSQMEVTINEIFTRVNEAREARRLNYIRMIRNQEPVTTQTPKRIFLMTSRHTSVIQYSTKGLAKAFQKLGYEVKLMIEENDMQLLYQDWRVKEIYDFNPYVVVNINHMYNDIINKKTWNIVWWQDPMEELTNDIPINVRERDIVFSYDLSFDELWIRKQTTPIFRQEFCFDSDIFKPNLEIKREEKVVFVGSSYFNFDFFNSNNPIVETLKEELILCLEKGVLVSEDEFIVMAGKLGIEIDRASVVHIMQAIVRDTTVQWLCQESHIPVEIYGRGWEKNPIVSPFFKGEVAHGKKLVDIYCSARYALVCQAVNLQSQRLVEVCACEAIPVVYDSRSYAPDLLWEDQYLFFKTREELSDRLKQVPKLNGNSYERVKSKFSYDCFAKKIHRMIPGT